MRRHWYLVPALFLFLALAAAGPSVADEKGKKSDWVQLFNGRDLTGWKVYPKGTGNWKVVDGAFTCTGPASHLFSERGDYQNFHYRIEALVTDGSNSGQYFRARYEAGFPKGYEAQINATQRDPIKTGSLYPSFGISREKAKEAGLLILEAPHKANEWFTQEVIADGNHIIIKVNGKTTVDFKDEKNTYSKGHFAIQHHDPGCVVKVRKVEVKELPASSK
jgi:hypothetical protein